MREGEKREMEEKDGGIGGKERKSGEKGGGLARQADPGALLWGPHGPQLTHNDATGADQTNLLLEGYSIPCRLLWPIWAFLGTASAPCPILHGGWTWTTLGLSSAEACGTLGLLRLVGSGLGGSFWALGLRPWQGSASRVLALGQ